MMYNKEILPYQSDANNNNMDILEVGGNILYVRDVIIISTISTLHIFHMRALVQFTEKQRIIFVIS